MPQIDQENAAATVPATAAAAARAHPAAASGRAASEDDSAFIPSATFAGPQPGYAFKSGPAGLGYYKEGVEHPASLTAANGMPQSIKHCIHGHALAPGCCLTSLLAIS